jgi:glucose-1-phosphate adenylyltransferase
LRNSLLADGCIVDQGAVIENSVIGLRCRIGRNVTIRNSVVMGNDWFPTLAETAADQAAGRPPLGIGEGSLVEGAIVDKNCRIGRNVRVINSAGVVNSPDIDNDQAVISEGVVVVPKDAVLPDGWKLC